MDDDDDDVNITLIFKKKIQVPFNTLLEPESIVFIKF